MDDRRASDVETWTVVNSRLRGEVVHTDAIIRIAIKEITEAIRQFVRMQCTNSYEKGFFNCEAINKNINAIILKHNIRMSLTNPHDV